MTQQNPHKPHQPDYSTGFETERRIAGTAVLLLDRFCKHQPMGERVFSGESYTVSESASLVGDRESKIFNIDFRGNSKREGERILRLEMEREPGAKTYQITSINSSLRATDIERFAIIRHELTKDLASSQTAQAGKQSPSDAAALQ